MRPSGKYDDMSPRRRTVLTAMMTTGVALPISGCLGDDGIATGGDDESPFETEPDALLLPREQLHEVLREGWVAEDPGDENLVRDAHAAVEYIPFDREEGEFHTESGTVVSGVWLFDDVETARDAFDDLPYHDGWGYETRAIAVESVGGTTDERSDTRILFRDANALGALQYENLHVDAETREKRGLELAALMHESWRE